jgi:hypothetical protein
VRLQGNSSSYYATSNSCLDSVLANRAGLPISLALLHAAVGEASGLTVQLVGMPGHVITRALVKAPGSKGLASSGVNPRGRGSNSGTAELAAGGVQGTSSIGPNDEDLVEDEMGSWMYIDVFNGGAELGDADLRYAVELQGRRCLLFVYAIGAKVGTCGFSRHLIFSGYDMVQYVCS